MDVDAETLARSICAACGGANVSDRTREAVAGAIRNFHREAYTQGWDAAIKAIREAIDARKPKP